MYVLVARTVFDLPACQLFNSSYFDDYGTLPQPLALLSLLIPDGFFSSMSFTEGLLFSAVKILIDTSAVATSFEVNRYIAFKTLL